MATLYSGVQFNNNIFYSATVNVQGFVPSASGSFRIQCDASDNNDQVFIDAVTIIKITGNELIEDGLVIKEISKPDLISRDEKLLIYPNPTNGQINLQCIDEIHDVKVIGMDGKEYKFTEINSAMSAIDVSPLSGGVYFLMVQTGNEILSKKFIKF